MATMEFHKQSGAGTGYEAEVTEYQPGHVNFGLTSTREFGERTESGLADFHAWDYFTAYRITVTELTQIRDAINKHLGEMNEAEVVAECKLIMEDAEDKYDAIAGIEGFETGQEVARAAAQLNKDEATATAG